MIALFLAALWLMPIDVSYVPVRLPVDSTIDRFGLVTLALLWLIALCAAGSYGPTWRRSKANIGVAVFLGIATASVLLNLTELARAEELQLALKKLSLLLCYAAFFVIVATSLRRRELSRFILLTLALASLTALGTIVEYRTGVNHFYGWAAKLPFLAVAPEPPDPEFGRPSIVGPTHHGLAIATILALVVPFILVGLMKSKERWQKILYVLALGLVLAGTVATLRKTALVLPGVALIALLVYQPRRMAKLLPLGVVMIVFMQGISPGALSGIRYQLEGGSELSDQGRTNDYAAVTPDIINHPLIGRGYGSYDPRIHEEKLQKKRHRILDNQFLLLLLEVGLIGLLAYVAIGALGIASLHRIARSKDLARAGPAAALIAAICAFLASNLLFDTLAFPQVPYLFFCLLAFGVLASQAPREASKPGG